jgi:predicted nucleic acid-binding protein
VSVVISDTSPLRALAHLGLLHLVPAIFDDVLIPPAVLHELENPAGQSAPVQLEALKGVRVVVPVDLNRIRDLREIQGLDLGEAEALALAIQVGALEVLIDEYEGRRIARELGLATVGVLGLLVRAKQSGLLDSITPLIDRLKTEFNFFISEALRSEIIRRASE